MIDRADSAQIIYREDLSRALCGVESPMWAPLYRLSHKSQCNGRAIWPTRNELEK